METTRLSTKGQVIIPSALCVVHNECPGLELEVIDSDDSILYDPKDPLPKQALMM